MSHKGIRIIVKIIVILFILSLGICIGAKISRHTNERGFGGAFRGAGCPMLQAGEDFQNWREAKNATPAVNTQEAVIPTATTTTK